MSNKDLTVEVVSNISHRLEGTTLKTFYGNKLWKTEDLQISNKLKEDALKYRADIDLKEKETEESSESVTVFDHDVTGFIQSYCAILYKYTRQRRSYSPKSKSWESFYKAAGTCKTFKMDPTTYITALTNYYTSVRREDKVTLPFPNQLHGEKAQEVILQYLANKSDVAPPEESVARKKVLNKRYLSLKEDEEYQAILIRFKNRTFTRTDFEYAKMRQIQMNSQAFEWMARYESILKDRESQDAE